MKKSLSQCAFPALAGALVAMLSALPAAGDDANSAEQAVTVPESGKITVVGKEFKYEPDAIEVKKGQNVTIVFKNEGQLSHNLTIPELDLHTDTIQTGAQDTIRFKAGKTGTYSFWCTVPGHKQAGMRGEITTD